MNTSDSFLSLIKALVVACFAAVAFSACDIIDETRKPVAPIDTTTYPIDTTGAHIGPFARKVILEEYTGHRCGFCPDGTELAYQLKNTYGSRLIIMSVHAGTFATATASATKFFYEFRTPTGTAMNQRYQVDAAGYPSAGINRMRERVYGKNEWAAIIDTMLQRAPEVDIRLTHTLDTLTRQVQLKVSTKFLQAVNSPLNLTVYMVETGLENWQKDYRILTPDKDIPDYKHKDFLRANLTSTWGNLLTSGPTPAGETLIRTFNYTVPAHFEMKNCRFVAVVNHPTKYEVVQAEEGKLLY